MSLLSAVLDAFAAEVQAFRDLVATRTEEEWERPTPADPWSVRDQVAHVTFVFNLASTAATDPEGFEAMKSQVGAKGFDAAVNAALALFNQGTPQEVLARYDHEAAVVTAALRDKDPDAVVPWLANPLPPHVLATAGMTELFAHGQDIADALGVQVERTDRIAALVPFIQRTVAFGYEARGLPVPIGAFRFAMQLPSGAPVEAGPADAPNLVCGDAVDLALLATRRRHLADLTLDAVGPDARGYLDVAQAYRGPAGRGRQSLSEASAQLSA